MTTELLVRLLVLVLGLIIIGIFACLPLYKWRPSQLITSSLFIKIIWWIPILFVLIFMLYGGLLAAAGVTLFIIILSVKEFYINKGWRHAISCIYYALFIIWTIHLTVWFLGLPSQIAVISLTSVAIISVMSDVCAFFMGNYLGKYQLPVWLNNRKSWEGVVGQIIGAIIGGILVIYWLLIPVSFILILLIGIASAIGDLYNSAAKRVLSIKDWGQTIPGHGGVMDRLSSLSFAVAVSYWYLVL